MSIFSNKFNSKAVKKATRVHTANFNGIGNKIKQLGLSPEDEETIITILDKSYTDGHMKIQHAAAAGTLVEKEETPAAVPVAQAPAALPDPSIDDVLGTKAAPATNGTATAATSTKTKAGTGGKKK